MELAFINKWLHLLSMIGVLGGTMFALIVLGPLLNSADGGGEAGKQAWKRFGMTLGGLWLVVLATGFVNQMIVTPKVNGHYQMLLGMKMGIALVMFFLSLFVAHPIPALAKFFRNRSGWLGLLIVLGIAVVGISAHLNMSRVNGSGLKSAPVAR